MIHAALENEVYFTCLPPNSTHIMQPLDVAVFKPLKTIWKEILDNYRKESRRKGSIPKTQFPVLLSELWHKLRPNIGNNLRSGFRATGLYPRNPNQPLKYLPDEVGSDTANVGRQLDSVLISMLKLNRGLGQTSRRGRGSKIVPGMRVTVDDTESSAPSAGAGPSGLSRGRRRSQARNRTTELEDSASSSSSDEDDECARCSVIYSTYRGLDWMQCVTCGQWICGKCNGGSDDPFYECSLCS